MQTSSITPSLPTVVFFFFAVHLSPTHTCIQTEKMRITSYSLNQWSAIENHHGVEEQARQEEVHTGTEQSRQLQRKRNEENYSELLFGLELLRRRY